MGDPVYRTFEYVLQNSGLIAKFVPDQAPPYTYINLNNLESRFERGISSRYGREVITKSGTSNTPLADTNIHTLGRMKSISPNTYRYAGAGTNLYRRSGDTNGAYTPVNGGNAMSGNRFSMVVFRPDFSSFPHIFFADSGQMLMDNGTLGTVQRWGIFPPTIPPAVSIQQPSKTSVEGFDTAVGLTFTNITATGTANRVNTTLSAAIVATGRQTATPVSMVNIIPGVIINMDPGGAHDEKVVVLEITATTFVAVFTIVHSNGETVQDINVTGSIAASTTGSVKKSVALNLNLVGSATAEDDDVMNFWIRISDPANVSEIRLMFDVGDGSFNTDYYLKTIVPSSLQDVVGGTTVGTQGMVSQVFGVAVGAVDTRQMSVASQLPDGSVASDDGDLLGLLPPQLFAGISVWSRVQVRRSEFVAVGLAGISGKNWANVNAWKVTVQTNETGSVTVDFDDIYLFGGNGPDVFAGVNYDYRYTYFDILTGAESNPSQTMIESTWVAPRRQPVKVTWTASSNARVSHVRVYRRGGTLSSAWHKVAEVAVGTTTFTDSLADSVIEGAKPLEIDNDPPVTSKLKSPVDTTLGTVVTPGSSQTVTPASMTNIFQDQYVTIGSGATEETVLVTSKTGSQFTAYFQYTHGTTDRVYAATRPGKGLNLAAEAFQRVWLAGDADNPNVLYYSKVARPESFSPAQYIEIGNPGDPIMAIVEHRGQLFVATMSTWWQIIGANTPVPIPLKTASNVGLAANFAWTIVNNEIWFMAGQGIYALAGAASNYKSELIAWITNGYNYGPVTAMDTAQRGSALMAYDNFNEVFISYIDTSAVRRRIAWSTTWNRWRNDSVPATAMLYEEDTYKLIIARANGMIYQDRVNDYDDDGYSGGIAVHTAIAFTLQSPYLDQGVPTNEKVYQNLTLDIDTAGQNVTATLYFNNGASNLVLSTTVNTATRDKVQLSINAGLGQVAYNCSLQVTGSVTSAVHVYQADIDGTVEAQKTRSFDTYWMKANTDEYKLCKQGWFEYVAPDAAGLNFACYIEGSATAEFTFNLPQTLVRTAMRVRFPATKAKIWRFIGTSASDFQIYDESHVEMKPVCAGKGYAAIKFQSAGGVQ